MTARAVIDMMIARAKINVKVARAIIEEILIWLRTMGSQGKKKINATVRMEEEDWDALQDKAKAMGMKSRTELLREIARGYIETKKALSTEERQVLGKY